MDEINLESSILGFCSLHKSISFVRNHGVLMRNDSDFIAHSSRVMLISGGGAGHEPGQQGFVGQGMLSAAVSGNIFTSPSVTSCLAAILLARDANRDILVVINNYTGDRLNFGLAVEMARNVYNYRNIQLLIVNDDCSIDNPRASTGRRGLAGIHLVNKIAGAMSDNGSVLSEIHEYCENLLKSRLIRTIGFAFHHDSSNELTDIEIGYGIHGEPGSIKIENEKNFKRIIHVLMEKLRLSEVKSDVVVLFNNLGGASEFIFYEFVKAFVEGMRCLELRVIKVYAGKFLTSLSKEALSVTVMEVRDAKLLEYLEFPIRTPSGHLFNCPLQIEIPNVTEFEIPEMTEMLSGKVARVTSEEEQLTRNAIYKACNAAIENKKFLNEIDSELGDGDTGSTLTRAAQALLRELKEDRIVLKNPYEMLLQISKILMNSMGGTSGAIFSIFFQCSSNAFAQLNEHSIKSWTEAISLGMIGIMHHGKSSIGDRTLLDSLDQGLKAMKEYLHKDKHISPMDLLKAFAEGCHKGSEATKSISPKSGRSSYSLSDKGSDFKFKSHYPDPGAHAIDVLSNAILQAFAESS